MGTWCRWPVGRMGGALALALLVALPGACGTTDGGSGGTRGLLVVGGSLRPNENAFLLTPPSSEVLPGTGIGSVADRVDLIREGFIPPVQNQRWNSCVAWTLGYVVMTAIEARLAREAGRWLDVTDPRNWFSPDYIYSQRDDLADRALRSHLAQAPICNELDGEIGCMRPERALEILATQGCGTWPWMCDEPAGEAFAGCTPGPASLESLSSRRAWGPASLGAAFFRPRCYVRFGATLDALDVDAVGRMKQWLDIERTPIAAVVRMTAGWIEYRGENRSAALASSQWLCDIHEERAVCLDAGGDELGSEHMFAIVGYDDTWPSPESHPGAGLSRSGSFLVVNQWGAKWGDRGTMWIPYDQLARIWVAGYGVLARDPAAASNGGIECVQDDDGEWLNLYEADDVPRNLSGDGTGVERSARMLPPPDPLGRQVVTSAIDAGDPADWYWFETTEDNVELTVAITGDDGNPVTTGDPLASDLRVVLTDEALAPVARSRPPAAPGVPATATASICGAGVWFVKVAPTPGAAPAPYTLTITRTALDCGTGSGNDCICGAEPTAHGANTSATLGPRGDATIDAVDWYRFDVDRESVFQVLLFNGATTDFSVWGGPGTTVAPLLGVGAVNPGFSVFDGLRLIVPPGRYYVRVTPEGGLPPLAEIPYTLTVAIQASFAGGAVPLVRVPGTNDGGPGPVRWTADVQVVNLGSAGQRLESPIEIDVPEGSITTISSPQDPTPRLFEIEATARVAWPDDGSSPSRCGARWPSTSYTELVAAPPACPVPIPTVMGSCAVGGELTVPPYRGPARVTLELALERDAPLDIHADVEHVAPPELPDGMTPANPRLLTLTNSCSETIGRTDVQDHLAIARGATDATWIVTVLDGCADMTIDAVDPGGAALALHHLGTRPGARHARLTVPAGSGMIWLRVSVAPGQPLARYTVRAWEPTGLPRVIEVDDEIGPAPRVAALPRGETVAGAIGPGDRWDILRLRAPLSTDGAPTVPMTLRLCTQPAGGALRLRVWSHRALLHDGGATCSPTTFQAPPGAMLTILVSSDGPPAADVAYTLEAVD